MTSSVFDAEGRQLDQIRLIGLSGFGRHGVFDHERVNGQMFSVDVVVHVDTRAAAAGDDFGAAVDYGSFAEAVVGVITGEPVKLVETLAERIATLALARDKVVAVDVAVHKPQAPITVPFADVVVAIRRFAPPLASPQPVAAEERDVTELDVPDLPPEPPTPVAVAALPFAVPEPLAVPESSQAVPTSPAETPAMPTDDRFSVDADDPLDRRPARLVPGVIALGANLGLAQQSLREAIVELDATPGVAVRRVSPLARTSPVGGPPQPDFLNVVVLIETSLAPRELLAVCQGLEQAHGRERSMTNGPRTLDVDVIAYDNLVASSDDVTVPHPRAHERAFVLAPWAHLDPNGILYGPDGGIVSELAALAPDQSGVHYMALDWFDESVLGGNQV